MKRVMVMLASLLILVIPMLALAGPQGRRGHGDAGVDRRDE
jgi:hypothetical protein